MGSIQLVECSRDSSFREIVLSVIDANLVSMEKLETWNTDIKMHLPESRGLMESAAGVWSCQVAFIAWSEHVGDEAQAATLAVTRSCVAEVPSFSENILVFCARMKVESHR